jgi:murein DD-endopeptidase MepM/ murein hydrolase activator NlpD
MQLVIQMLILTGGFWAQSANPLQAFDSTPPISPVHVARPFAPPAADWLSGHRGVDLSGSLGQRVVSPGSGVVTFAGAIGGKPVVVLDHGHFRTTYEPVVAAVSVGSQVDVGETLGQLQVFHSHCFPASCLHWGLIVGGQYRDPMSLLGRSRVRLLPDVRQQFVPGPACIWLCPGVGLLEGAPQAVGRDVGIELGRGHRRMAKELLY